MSAIMLSVSRPFSRLKLIFRWTKSLLTDQVSLLSFLASAAAVASSQIETTARTAMTHRKMGLRVSDPFRRDNDQAAAIIREKEGFDYFPHPSAKSISQRCWRWLFRFWNAVRGKKPSLNSGCSPRTFSDMLAISLPYPMAITNIPHARQRQAPRGLRSSFWLVLEMRPNRRTGWCKPRCGFLLPCSLEGASRKEERIEPE